MRSPLLLQATDLSLIQQRRQRLHAVNLSLEKGQVLGLLGVNGAGKSTTLAVLSGALAPTGGQVFINGLTLHRQPCQAKRQLGLLPEQPALYPQLTVDENLDFAAGLRGLQGQAAIRARQKIKQRLDLKPLSRRLCGRLSKGQQQRVGIAQALIHRPALLLLDEPTAGLDPAQARHLRQFIKELTGHCGILLATHILADVEHCCTRVLMLNQGRVVAEEPVHNEHILRVRLQHSGLYAEDLAQLSSVRRVLATEGRGWFSLELNAPAARFAQEVTARSWPLAAMIPGASSLEQRLMRVMAGTEPAP